MKRIDVRKSKRKPPFDPKVFLDTENSGRTISKYRKHQTLFSQGSTADAVFYIRKGKVKISVVSEQGKEAVVAIQGPDEFCGEGCLTGQARRLATAAAITECEIMRLEKSAMIRVLHDEPAFSEMFVAHLLIRTIRVEEDLVDQLFNSSEKRLARALLLLANFGKDGRPEPVIAKVNQETLAELIGTTRSRVSHFMNKIAKFGPHRLQRPHRSPQFIVECRSARPTANQGLTLKFFRRCAVGRSQSNHAIHRLFGLSNFAQSSSWHGPSIAGAGGPLPSALKTQMLTFGS